MRALSREFFALALSVTVVLPVFAQERFPSKAITIITPITAGTTIDILARLFADGLSKKFGQQVLVLNRPGAGGIIAAQALLNAPADGYTISSRQFRARDPRFIEQTTSIRPAERFRWD